MILMILMTILRWARKDRDEKCVICVTSTAVLSCLCSPKPAWSICGSPGIGVFATKDEGKELACISLRASRCRIAE